MNIENGKKIRELKIWFRWYDKQVMQYNRCQRLGIDFDKDIEELDAEAEEKAKEIKQLQNS